MRRCMRRSLAQGDVLGAIHAIELSKEAVGGNVAADALGLVEASTQMPVTVPLVSKPMMTDRMPPSKPFSSALMAREPSVAFTAPVMFSVV